MIRAELKGMLARRLRLALTALAIALGVTLVAGTYVFTDTINDAFDKVFAAQYAHTDAVVTPRQDEGLDENGTTPSLPASLLAQVRKTSGIADAEGRIFAPGAVVLDKHGKRIGHGGAPQFIASVHRDHRFSGVTYVKGRRPQTADEVALDKQTAERGHFHIGDQVAIQGVTPLKRYTLVGLTEISGVGFGGASVNAFILPEAQRVAGQRGRFDEIDAAAANGLAPQELARRLRAALPPSATVRTGAQQAADLSQNIRKNLGFLRTALLAFAGISLFVGAFLIFNTFSITVVQRTREFALLRTLGAHRRQVLRAVLAEGLVLGVLGSLAGLGLGIALATGLRALFKSFGVELPSTSTVIAGRTVVASMIVGLLVTVVASVIPALRATRVPPIAALREGSVLPPGRFARWASPIAAVVTVAGLGLLGGGLFGGASSSTALSLTGGGAALLFLGVALLSPRLVGPIAAAVGRPLERMAGVTGRLARENAIRQPGRTAATAAALMIGVALVGFASIFASSASTTFKHAFQTGSRAQAVLQNTNGFAPFSPQATQAVAKVPGVTRVSALRFSGGRTLGDKLNVVGIDPATLPSLFVVASGEDALRALGPGKVAVSKKFADKHHTKVGDRLLVRTPRRTTVALTVDGVVDDKAHFTGDLNVAQPVLEREFGTNEDGLVFVGYAPGADGKRVLAAIKRRLKSDFPQVDALSSNDFVDKQITRLNRVLSLIYALLALAVIVSLFGIVNTLVLSITERTRELGMLRAVGTSRRQVRRMIRYEAVITALIGGVLGCALGVLLAVLVSRVVDDFHLTVQPLTILVLLVLSAVAGVIAAVLPARRASRLDVLQALAYE
jgi:putative ABC transport system permease protein